MFLVALIKYLKMEDTETGSKISGLPDWLCRVEHYYWQNINKGHFWRDQVAI